MPFQFTCETCARTFTRRNRPSSINPHRFCSLACRRTPPQGIAQDDGSVLVPLTQGKFAIIDAIDAEAVLKHRWRAVHWGKTWYALRSRKQDDGPGPKNIHMHIALLDPPEGRQVDHRDRNGLNNRRSNLRPATRSQNNANTKHRSDNTSGYKGVVARLGHPKPWQASIGPRYLGIFETPEEAARAYDAAARETYGEFAVLNFPDNPERRS